MTSPFRRYSDIAREAAAADTAALALGRHILAKVPNGFEGVAISVTITKQEWDRLTGRQPDQPQAASIQDWILFQLTGQLPGQWQAAAPPPKPKYDVLPETTYRAMKRGNMRGD